jgi:hypothetical protein
LGFVDLLSVSVRCDFDYAVYNHEVVDIDLSEQGGFPFQYCPGTAALRDCVAQESKGQFDDFVGSRPVSVYLKSSWDEWALGVNETLDNGYGYNLGELLNNPGLFGDEIQRGSSVTYMLVVIVKARPVRE